MDPLSGRLLKVDYIKLMSIWILSLTLEDKLEFARTYEQSKDKFPILKFAAWRLTV